MLLNGRSDFLAHATSPLYVVHLEVEQELSAWGDGVISAAAMEAQPSELQEH